MSDRRGGVLIMHAISLLVLLGAAALAIDYGRATLTRQLLSNAADAAALAAVSRLPDVEAARAMAIEYVEKNMPSSEHGTVLNPADVEIGTWDAQSRTFIPAADQASGSGTAIRVSTRRAQSNGNGLGMTFAVLLGTNSLDISASAVAGRSGAPCVIALDPTLSPSLRLDSNAQLEVIGCGVQVNSTSSGALEASSNSGIQATDICVGGTADLPTGGTVSPAPNEFCPGQSDPLASLAPPAHSGCNHHSLKYSDADLTLMPGVYCGGLEIDGNSEITLSPGTYVIRDGPFRMLSNSSVTGEEVTVFLTGTNSLLFFDSNSSVSLTAPTSGPLEGMLFFQDRTGGGIHVWNGNSRTTLRGVIYLPSAKLRSENVSKMTPLRSCTVLITNEMEFNSNSGVSIDVSAADCRAALPGPYRNGIVLLQ